MGVLANKEGVTGKGMLRDHPLKLAILTRVCTGYRVGLFRELSAVSGYKVRLFIGKDIPGSKVRSAADLSGLDIVRLPTRFIRLGGRVIPHHKGLRNGLEKFQPHVIICEGESNILSYIKALWYRRRHRQVGLVHWSLGGIPGVDYHPRSLLSRAKYFFQKHFDIFVVYSTFGKRCLIELGHPPEKIVVATNVADTSIHLDNADRMQETPSEARAKLGLPDRFTVLYAGTMDANKRPDLLLDLAKELDAEHYNYVLLGSGAMLEELRSRAKTEGLRNVFLPSHVSDKLPLYYRASDVMVLPGRGGMVISEAMAWSLPVVVHHADGTEFDLVRDGETGLLLADRGVKDLREALETMRLNPDQTKAWGASGKQLLINHFTLNKMIEQMVRANLEAIHAARD